MNCNIPATYRCLYVKHILKGILVFLFTSNVYAQNYSITKYSTEDGLPSNEVFSITQDIQGYIWICSDKGISRFDGHKFITYGIIDGLSSSVVYKVLASPLGGIVFFSSDNKVGTIRNDSIFYFGNDGKDHISRIYKGEKGIAICFQDKSVIEFYDWEGNMLEELHFPDGPRLVEIDDFGQLFTGVKMGKLKPQYQHKNGELVPLSNYVSTLKHNFILNESQDFKIIASGKELTLFGEGNKVSQISLPATSTSGGLIDSKNQIWVGLYDKGVMVVNANSKEESFRLLDGKTVSSIHEDTEQNIWLSTLEDGLFMLRHTDYQLIFQGRARKMVRNNSEIITILNDSSLLAYNTIAKDFKKLDVNQKIYDQYTVGNRLIASIDGKLNKRKLSGTTVEFFRFGDRRFFDFKHQPMAISYAKILYQNGDTGLNRNIRDIMPGYTYTSIVKEDTIYTGRSSGLYKVYEHKGQFVSQQLLPLPVTSMITTEDHYVFGTKGHGLIITNKDFIIQSKYTSNDGLASDFISALERRDDSIFCATNEGMSLIFNAFDSASARIYLFSTYQGLLSKNIEDILLYEDELFVTSDKGLQSIELKKLDRSSSNPKPIIEHLNGKSVSSVDTPIIPAGKSAIRIQLNNIFFDDHKKYINEYRLLGVDTTWTPTSSTEIEFLNLSPGQYELQYRCRLPENEQYSFTKLNFELQPLFTQTIGFKILVGLVLLLFGFLVFYLRERYISNKSNMLLTQERLKYQALTAQLNPHFMFNALGSIQHLILSKQNNEAAENLATFSRLLNQSIKNTNLFFIPLTDEIAFIDEYTEVEKSRFEQPFIFKWSLSSEIIPEQILVPTMFLQPYIENSIIHGIVPKNEAGEISVFITPKNNKVLKIRIIDNGIGFKTSNKHKRGRQSIAIVNSQHRIEAMEKMYGSTFKQEIKELKYKDGSIAGTEVIIEIPYKLKQ